MKNKSSLGRYVERGWMRLKDINWKGLNVGVTGSEIGPHPNQKGMFLKIVRSWVSGLPASFHDGDCMGVDDYAHRTVFHVWTPSLLLVGHPPNKPDKRAFNAFNIERPKKGYLKRDDEMAREIDVLIALPYEWNEVDRSGTWATVRYARKHGKIIVIIRPDGSLKIEDHRRKGGPLFE